MRSASQSPKNQEKKVRWQTHPPWNSTPSMPPPPYDRTHWSEPWSISANMSLYTLPDAAHPGHARPRKIGEVVAARWTKSQPNDEGESPPSFYLSVLAVSNSKGSADSQDVDNLTHPQPVWFIVQEDYYQVFTNDGWTTHPQLLEASAKSRSSTNQGKWFKDFVKANQQQLYDPELSTLNSQPQTPQAGQVAVGSSTPHTPNPSNSRSSSLLPLPTAFPPLAKSSSLLSPQPAAAGASVALQLLAAGMFPRTCVCRTKIRHQIVYRNPLKHPRISYHPSIFI